jgi:hypothetical protein
MRTLMLTTLALIFTGCIQHDSYPVTVETVDSAAPNDDGDGGSAFGGNLVGLPGRDATVNDYSDAGTHEVRDAATVEPILDGGQPVSAQDAGTDAAQATPKGTTCDTCAVDEDCDTGHSCVYRSVDGAKVCLIAYQYDGVTRCGDFTFGSDDLKALDVGNGFIHCEPGGTSHRTCSDWRAEFK